MADTGDSRIRLSFEGPLATIVIARQDKLNALDYRMVLALEQAARLVEEQTAVRAAIITGEGEKSFCAGGDIEAWSALSPGEFGLAWVRHGHRAFDALARLRQPLIAVLNGHTLGGGLELAATADFRIAEQHVKIGSPETGLGIIPGWSGTQRSVNRFGPQLVRRMALLGELFTAEEGLGLGLVDALAPRGRGMAAATEMAQRIMHRGPLATQSAKMLINAAEGEEVHRPLEALAGGLASSSEELKEGLAAFRQKRPPEF
ncbi:enoyl-CoA hydratase/isomerase family protein [Aestuariivirga sp.]|uniref:enoyl-CoA hydratase/isomerase family protein n=1 Tax=Aestuariivirga sp. TaxID=2650926 RepID=UPI00391C3020